MKHRKNRVKREHSVLGRLAAALDEIGQSGLAEGIIPGPIRKIPPHPDRPTLRFQYATGTGGKYLGYGPGAVQEVFIVCPDLPRLHARFPHLIDARDRSDRPDRALLPAETPASDASPGSRRPGR